MLVPGRPVTSVPITRVRKGRPPESVEDPVTVEEPMEIRVEHWSPGKGKEGGEPGFRVRSVSVTMRTPGDDFELAAGFLFTEGLITGRDAIREIAYCTRGQADQEYNIVTVRLAPDAPFDPDLLSRNFYMTSSCGVCGKASLEAVEVQGCTVLPPGGVEPRARTLPELPGVLRDAQEVFEETGGIHAAGFFGAGGELRELREDVGRHNAVDKLVGAALLEGRLPLADGLLAVSGRASFEILQKALVARIPMVLAVGAPSSLAVDLARRFGMTLVGFTRDGGFNVYAGRERIRGLEEEGS